MESSTNLFSDKKYFLLSYLLLPLLVLVLKRLCSYIAMAQVAYVANYWKKEKKEVKKWLIGVNSIWGSSDLFKGSGWEELLYWQPDDDIKDIPSHWHLVREDHLEEANMIYWNAEFD